MLQPHGCRAEHSPANPTSLQIPKKERGALPVKHSQQTPALSRHPLPRCAGGRTTFRPRAPSPLPLLFFFFLTQF